MYAAARNPETVDLPGVIPLRLDVTDAESITAAAQIASDVTLLVNNAGISTSAPLIGATSMTFDERWTSTSTARSP